MAKGDDHRSTASDDEATVERTVDLREQGIIVRLTVSTDRDGDVQVTVDDELPVGLDTDRVAFHPNHAPEEGDASPDGVSVSGTVSEGADLVAVYGVQVDASRVSDVALTDPRLTVTSEVPSDNGSVTGLIRRVLGREDQSTSSGTDGNAGSSSPAGTSDSVAGFESLTGDTEDGDPAEDDGAPDTPSDGEAGDLESVVDRVEDGAEDQAEDAARGDADSEADAADDVDPTDVSEAEAEFDSTADADETAESDTEPAAEFATESTSEPATDSTSAFDSETESTSEFASESMAGADSDTESEAPSMVSEIPGPSDEPDEQSDRSTASGEATAAAGAGNVAAMLAEEIENGEVTGDDLDVLREHLGSELTGSQAARLDHVQTRMDEFAAYADTLREFLDEHGNPAQVFGELQADLESLESNVSDLEAAIGDLEVDLSTAADERDALREDIDVTAAEIATVEEELADELDAVGDEIADELGRVERQARAAREGIKSDLAEMEVTLEQLEEMRAALETAFASGREVESSQTATERGSVDPRADSAPEEQPASQETGVAQPDGERTTETDGDAANDTTETEETEAESREYGADGGIDLAAVEREDGDHQSSSHDTDPAERDRALDS